MTQASERKQQNGDGKKPYQKNSGKNSPAERRPLTEMIDRQPPFDLQAEIGVLGSVVLLPEVLDSVVQILKPTDFYDDAHSKLYTHMLAMYESGKKFDDVLLVARLKQHDDYEMIGGAAYLSKIINAVPNAAHASYYAAIVHDKAIYRAVIVKSTEILRNAYDESCSPVDLLGQADSGFALLSENNLADNELCKADTAMTNAMLALEKRMTGDVDGLTTGISGFDDVHRLKPGELTIIGGRTSMGKSAICANIAVHVAKHQHDEAVLFVSLEMTQLELSNRMLCAEGRVDFRRMLRGSINSDDRAKLVEAAGSLGQLPLYIDDQPSKTVSQIAAQARRLKRKTGLALVIIDYLQLVEPDKQSDSRQEQVAKIARRLKLMARELSIPVIALAQVNRQAESSKDCKPKLSHLRESGAIEQDADNVLFVHRPKYYTREMPEYGKAEEAEIILAKGRNAPTIEIPMHWFGMYQRWDNPAPAHVEQAASTGQTWTPYADGGSEF